MCADSEMHASIRKPSAFVPRAFLFVTYGTAFDSEGLSARYLPVRVF